MAVGTVSALMVLSDLERAHEVAAALNGHGISDISFVESTHDAINCMVERRYGLIFVDARVPVTLGGETILYGGVDFIRFVRMCKPPVCKATVAFIRNHVGSVSLIESRADVMDAHDAGVDCVLTYPVTDEKVAQVVLPELAIPRPFLRTETYIGPCRRRRNKAFSAERRHAAIPSDSRPARSRVAR